MNKEHVLMCIMAESCAGKDTIVDKLCERTKCRKLISYTTRSRRKNEENTHIFVTEEEFQQMLNQEQVAAYTEINNCKYWCTIEQLYSSEIYEIDPYGVNVLKSLNLPNLRIVTVYINVPEDIRKERAMKRGDDVVTYKSRCFSERNQFREMKKNMDVDYVIPNIDFAKAFSVLKWIVTVEGVWKNHEEDESE